MRYSQDLDHDSSITDKNGHTTGYATGLRMADAKAALDARQGRGPAVVMTVFNYGLGTLRQNNPWMFCRHRTAFYMQSSCEQASILT